MMDISKISYFDLIRADIAVSDTLNRPTVH
jgi:hypothetical protein